MLDQSLSNHAESLPQASRRHFLKFGAALPLALHSLETYGAEARRSAPRRIIFICNSLGFYAPYFFPSKRGDVGTSEYLKDVGPANKMTVFQNFFHPGMETSNHDSEKSFLTGTPNPESSTFVNDISVDQVFANELGGETRFPFLNFSIYDRGWGCSWNDRGAAIPPMHDEEKIFDLLFGEDDLDAKRKRIENDAHVLQCLYRDLRALESKDGVSEKLGSYRNVIRKLETRLERERYWLKTTKPKVERTLSKDREFAFSTKVHNLFELAKLAFRTDSTRVITFSMDWIYGAIRVPGATGGWHTLSHHGGNPDRLARLKRVELDILKHFNRFLMELDFIQEEGGTLLDHTTVVMGSNFGDSSNHTCHALPTIVAGGGYKHESHRVMAKSTPLCNLFLELLNNHGIDVGKFGTSGANMRLL